jgi:hypothetical protein
VFCFTATCEGWTRLTQTLTNGHDSQAVALLTTSALPQQRHPSGRYVTSRLFVFSYEVGALDTSNRPVCSSVCTRPFPTGSSLRKLHIWDPPKNSSKYTDMVKIGQNNRYFTCGAINIYGISPPVLYKIETHCISNRVDAEARVTCIYIYIYI